MPSKLGTLSYDWTSLNNQVDAMSAGGTTNQTIGLAWAWQALTDGDPLNAGTLPPDTKLVIIHLSDGLNTQNRWDGNGSQPSTSVDDRMNNGLQQRQGRRHHHLYGLRRSQRHQRQFERDAELRDRFAIIYFDLTTSGAIITTFNQIAQEITNLRVAK